MAARDPYALTQVPSPLIQPGRYRFGKHKTVVIGEEGDGAQAAWEAPDPTWTAGRSAQDAPAPDTRVDPSTFRVPRPVMDTAQVERQRKKHNGCLIAVIVFIVLVVFGSVGACSALMDAFYSTAGGLGDSYEDSGSYEYSYDEGYDYLDDFDSSAYDVSVFDEVYGDEADSSDAGGSDTYDDVRAASNSVYEALEGFESGLSSMDW